MTTTELLSPDAKEVEGKPVCASCAHDLAAHDAIGSRYCQATEASVLCRGCICRPPG